MQDLQAELDRLEGVLELWRNRESKILFSIIFIIGLALIGVGSLVGIFSLELGFLLGGFSLLVYAYFMHGQVFLPDFFSFIVAIAFLTILAAGVWCFKKKWKQPKRSAKKHE